MGAVITCVELEMDTDEEKKSMAKLVSKSKFGPVVLTQLLLDLARTNRNALEELWLAAPAKDLEEVFLILTLYPHTDVGWQILPLSRAPYMRDGLERAEIGDIHQRQFQEDRPHVEFLRAKIRP